MDIRQRPVRGGRWSVAGALTGVLTMALLAFGSLAGCAQPDGENILTPGESVSSSGSASAGPSGGPSVPAATPAPASPKPPAGGSPGVGEMTITGQLVDGVEPGCLLLQTPDKLYLLVGADTGKLRGATRATVTGTPQPGLMTTCQQGTPFKVTDARPA